MSQYDAPKEMTPEASVALLRRRKRSVVATSCGALLAAVLSAPVFAAGTDVSADEIYSDGVTLTTFDGAPLDINGDGEVDLAVASNQSGVAARSRWYPGNGDGTFGAAVLFDATGTGASSEIVAADFNGDGDIDLVQARRDLTNLLYLGDGAGGLQGPVPVGADTRRHLSVALGDLDSDGDLDIVIGTGHPGGVSGNPVESNRYCLNDFVPSGTDTFTTCGDITADADDTRGIALADMDGDGDLDVIAGNDETTPGANRVYLNQFVGSGTVGFDAGIDFGDPDDQTSKILIGDLNDDGLPDIVTVNNVSTVGQAGNGVNRFFINETNGGAFALSAANDVSADTDRSSGGRLADFDGDGDLDLAVANLLSQDPGVEFSRNRLYLNQFEESGTVSFGTGLDISADEHQSRELAAADINGDDLVDIVVGNQNSAGVKDRVYLNSGNPADPFGDGPFFTSTAPLDAEEGIAYTYDITTSDPDATDTLAIDAPTLPAWLTLTDNGDGTATLTGTPTAAEIGDHPVSLEVSDGTNSAVQDFTITVVAAAGVNNPPAFTSTAVTDAEEGVVYTYDVVASDADAADVLEITAPTLPAWLTLTDNGDGTATLTGTPTAAEIGDNPVSLQVSDGTDTAVQDFTVTVVAATGANNAPTFTSTAVTDAQEGVEYTYDVEASDADSGDVLEITAPTLPSWLTVTDNGDGTATLSGTPTAAEVGDHAVSLQVSDGTDTALQDFTITVEAASVEPPPTFPPPKFGGGGSVGFMTLLGLIGVGATRRYRQRKG